MKLKLMPKVIISLAVLAIILTIVISLFSYHTSKNYLEEMYAERVMVNCNAIAAMMDPEDIRTIHPGAEVLSVSATKGDGIGAWFDWLRAKVKAKKDGAA